MIPWSVVVEGDSDLPIVDAMLRSCGQHVGSVHGRRGKADIDARLRGYLAAAKHSRWLVLRDLDHDADCAAGFLESLRRHHSPIETRRMLRLAVRTAEAWLLADEERCAQWLGVARHLVPRDVEALTDPKGSLLQLVKRSRRRDVLQDMAPRGTARIGPGHVDQVRRYCRDLWRPSVAAERSPSLAACLAFVRDASH